MHLPDANYCMVNHIFTGAGYPRGAQVTYGFSVQGTGGTVAGWAAALHSLWASNMMPQLSTSLTLSQTRVKQGPDDVGPFAFAGSPAAGAISGDSDAPSVSILVKKNTASGGKKNSGRWFLPGLSETFTDVGGTISSAYLANLQAACDAFKAAVVARTDIDQMVLLHNDTVTSPTVITSLAVQNKVATQRRRLRKVGGRRRTVFV